MISRTRIPLLAACTLILSLLGPAFVQAKPAKISGKLSARGYMVIALGASGKAKTDRVAHGKFKLRPPARKVTLQLRAPDGTYAGPIVVATKEDGQRAIVGVKAGAKLGKIKVNPGDGYARLATRLPGEYVDLERTALAEQGTPVGAGNLGRVRASTGGGAPGDGDLDGIPNPLDVDDDGDVILDRFDPEFGTVAARASADTPDVVVRAISLLNLDLPDVVNANAPGLSEEQVEAALPSFGGLILGSLGIEAEGQTDPPVELDCGDPDTGLIYCRRNGSTGTITSVSLVPRPPGGSPGDPFPGCCDRDEDGFGSLGWVTIPGSGVDAHAVPLLHGATSDQVGAGDLLIARATRDDGNEAFTGTLSSLRDGPRARLLHRRGRKLDRDVVPGLPGRAGDTGEPVRPHRRPRRRH